MNRRESVGYAMGEGATIMAIPALIEAVIAMGGGMRFDPKIDRALRRGSAEK